MSRPQLAEERAGHPKLRVLLADDHPLVRSGIRATLAGEEHIELVGEAKDGLEAQRLCFEHQPDLLLLDLSMPGPTPLETIAAVRARAPRTRVLVLTAYDDDTYVRGIMSAGVDGYLLKDEATEALLQAMTTLVRGGTYFSRAVVQRLAGGGEAAPPPADFTPREVEMLQGVARGWDNRRIAAEFELAEQTVRNYISRIYDKLGVHSRAEAVVWARKQGYAED